MTLSKDTIYLAANILQAGRIGSTFEWALGAAIDNADHFHEHGDRIADERSARAASKPEPTR